MEEKLKDVVVIYHAQCTDGFGAAFAAWKTFGDNATYIPQKTQVAISQELKDKEIYVVDYGLTEEVQQKLEQTNKKVVVIDHHPASQAGVEAFPNNVFDPTKSGAVLTWEYFYPDTQVPELLLYVQDHDLWQFELPNTRAFGSALKQHDHDFAIWDKLATDLEDQTFKDAFIQKGETIAEFEDGLVEHLLEYKERVLLDGHEVWAINASRVYRSILGHKLAELNADTDQPEIGVVYYRNQGAVHISLRSNGPNVREIAEKFGGGGHDKAASIRAENWDSLPFTYL